MASGAKGAKTVGVGWNRKSHEALAASLTKDETSDAWYTRRGKMVPNPISYEWATTMLACAGLISFDAVLCRGPRHFNSPAFGQVAVSASSGPSPDPPSQWAVATHSLGGCAGCGSAPEGWTVWGETTGQDAQDDSSPFPLLAPPSMHSSNTKVASCPSGASLHPNRWSSTKSDEETSRFIPRCMECLRDRYCWGCNKWWCEKCFEIGTLDSQGDMGLYYKVRDGCCTECWRKDFEDAGLNHGT